MSFLKQLLTPFVEFDENESKQKQNAEAKKNVPAQEARQAPAPQPAMPAEHPLITGSQSAVAPAAEQIPTYSPSGTLSVPLPEHVQYFEKLIDDANKTQPSFQGVDYKEFVDSKLDIDDIQDEAIRYNTAFNVLKSSGLTKGKLLSTGQEYLDLIGRDLNAFQSAYAVQYGKEVRPKEMLVQQKAEELQQLAQRINVLKGEINNLTQEINVTKDKLNTTKNSFLLAEKKSRKKYKLSCKR